MSAAAQAEHAIEEEEVVEFKSIEELQSVGINVSDITKLKGAGIHTVGQFLSTPSKGILAIKGLSDAKLEKLQEASRKLQPTGFQSGGEVLRQSTALRIRIHTGCKDLDAILGGGLETGSVTEVFGEFRSGKTQLAATLAVTAQLERSAGGASGKVIILDTENAFRIERVAEIAEKRYGLDPAAVLDNITFARCLQHEHQQEMVVQVAALITGSAERYRLLIVDSVIGLFRTEFTGRGELAERQQKLGAHIRALVKIASEFNIAVLLTNQITADPGNMFVADAKKPVGGNMLAHFVHTRVHLRKGKNNQRIAKIYAGPLPEEEATFALTENGVVDVE